MSLNTSRVPTNSSDLRADTPGCETHIHLNNAGASLMPDRVVRAVTDHLSLEAKLGGYEAAALMSEEAQRLYSGAAELLGCDADEIAFADSGSRAWNAILYAVPLAPGDVVITTQPEFGSNVVSLVQHCRNSDAELRVVRCNDSGSLDVDDLDAKWDDRVKLAAVTHVAAHRGYVAPIEEFARRARESGAFFLLDAAQAVGQMRLDVRALGCHALVATGRKWLRGPRGTAFLYVSKNLPLAIEPPFCDLAAADFVGNLHDGYSIQFRKDARRFELWERSIAAAIGLGAAIDYLRGIDEHLSYDRVSALGGYLTEAIHAVAPQLQPLADPAGRVATVGLTLAGVATPAAVKEALADAQIAVSTMSDWDAPWDFAALGVDSILRVAPHYFNEESEIDAFVATLRASLGTK